MAGRWQIWMLASALAGCQAVEQTSADDPARSGGASGSLATEPGSGGRGADGAGGVADGDAAGTGGDTMADQMGDSGPDAVPPVVPDPVTPPAGACPWEGDTYVPMGQGCDCLPNEGTGTIIAEAEIESTWHAIAKCFADDPGPEHVGCLPNGVGTRDYWPEGYLVVEYRFGMVLPHYPGISEEACNAGVAATLRHPVTDAYLACIPEELYDIQVHLNASCGL